MKQRFTCTYCELGESLDGSADKPFYVEEVARAAGWRLGTNGKGEKVAYCPECAGVDPDYWDSRTLAMANMAGIGAGTEHRWGAA
ncbi:hypothetical protein [Micromonospora sp. NPDC005299]|uniref:hypothetical protein n=1 Tax=Micromonospora sp. NPDC005299 TaxID=3364231 RepID=UPI0036D0DB84